MATYDWPSDTLAKEAAPDSQASLASEEYPVKRMLPILGTFDMTAIYVAAIFWIGNTPIAVASGGAAAFTYLVLGGVTFFIPCAIATAQLGMMFPHEGSLYNWTHKALGGYWSFFAGFCAWLPGMLVILAGSFVTIDYIQALNPNWLVEQWQQAIACIILISASGFIATQRFRLVQNIVNVAVCLMILGTVLVGLAGIAWLLKWHIPATNLTHPNNWLIKPGNSANLALFGIITLAYLGTEVPLYMGGEITGRIVIKRHLLWGTLLVLIGYFVSTFSVLVVEGPVAGASITLVVNTVSTALGTFAGDITAICCVAFFAAATIVYNYAFARLLFVASIDQRLPAALGKLNRNRVPGNATIFQTFLAAIIATIIFIVVPYVIPVGKPTDLANDVYSVTEASTTLVWGVSASFLFINLVVLYFRNRRHFDRQRIFPLWVLRASVVLGPIACFLAIIDTLLNSWISAQINNQQWTFVVGGVTLACLGIAAVGGLFASSEAAWQRLKK